jgi:hypothetical protein
MTGLWQPAVNGNGKHPWFLWRDVPGVGERNYWSKKGTLVRYATRESAQRAADRLNRSGS